ncbi:sterol desaturase family protein [Methyloceanibacter superfactus]|uniref:sterol desaturase family protein n=1 Tax=Methyloceanibacter superfactus TaxID=1774969 RepID=UPI001300E652|nr:sterol desaturase family protein [Methyloceanibacter superfactus]
MLPYEVTWNDAHGDTVKDLAHAAVYEIANLFALVVFIIISASLLPEWSLWPSTLPIAVQFLLAIVIVDCTMTVVHYFSHRVDWLWRLHAVHHGVHRLYGFNGFIRHPLHQALDIVAGTLPLVLLGLPVDVAVLLGFTIAVQLIVQHSNVDYMLGPLQKILAIGPVHRLHHVNWAGEGDVNFGLFFTAWDRLLGTYQPPQARKPRTGDIGIQDCPHYPQVYAKQLVAPFDPDGFCPKDSARASEGRQIT